MADLSAASPAFERTCPKGSEGSAGDRAVYGETEPYIDFVGTLVASKFQTFRAQEDEGRSGPTGCLNKFESFSYVGGMPYGGHCEKAYGGTVMLMITGRYSLLSRCAIRHMPPMYLIQLFEGTDASSSGKLHWPDSLRSVRTARVRAGHGVSKSAVELYQASLLAHFERNDLTRLRCILSPTASTSEVSYAPVGLDVLSSSWRARSGISTIDFPGN